MFVSVYQGFAALQVDEVGPKGRKKLGTNQVFGGLGKLRVIEGFLILGDPMNFAMLKCDERGRLSE
jgi:hypothetical protein